MMSRTTKIMVIALTIIGSIMAAVVFSAMWKPELNPKREYTGKVVANQYDWGLATIISTTWYFEDGQSLKVDGEMPLEIGATYEIVWKKAQDYYLKQQIEIISLRKIS